MIPRLGKGTERLPAVPAAPAINDSYNGVAQGQLGINEYSGGGVGSSQKDFYFHGFFFSFSLPKTRISL